MSYFEGTNYQAKREDEGKSLFERIDNNIENDVRTRLSEFTVEEMYDVFKQDFEAYRANKISFGKLNETVKGLLIISKK